MRNATYLVLQNGKPFKVISQAFPIVEPDEALKWYCEKYDLNQSEFTCIDIDVTIYSGPTDFD